MKTHNVKWQASLSSGETVFEEKGKYRTIPGELSPWNRLLKHIKDNDLTITSLALYTDEGRTYNLPSAGKNPKFHAFSQSPTPHSFRMFRAVGQDILDAAEEVFTVAEASYAGYVLQFWVNEADPDHCWVLTIPKGGAGETTQS